MTDAGDDPYRPPDEPIGTTNILLDVLAGLFIVVATLVAGGFTFFVTCLGVGIILFDVIREAAILLAVILGLAAATFAMMGTYRACQGLFSPQPPDRPRDPPRHPDEQRFEK